MNERFDRSQVESQTQYSGSTASLEVIAEICERAALGDLEARVTCGERDPATQRMCQAINRMLDLADSFARETAAMMDCCARDQFHRPILLRGLKGAYRSSAAIINRAGLKMRESSGQLAFTAKIADETAANVNMIAAACEELNSTSSEISRQTAESVTMTGKAVSLGSEAHAAMNSLSGAARKIESILSLINRTADQTNLLALNATIEAARAGERGRGFAVVANEVKELSRGCAKAAGEISQQVEMMRATVSQAASIIGAMNQAIAKINDGASLVAESVREQVEATADISRNIAEASENTTRISERIHGKGAGPGNVVRLAA